MTLKPIGERLRRGAAVWTRCQGWVAAILLLGVWPVVSHLRWHRLGLALHGVPALFLGLLAWVLGWGAVGCLRGVIRHGLRWLVTAPAFRRIVATTILAVSTVVLFYSVERWRGTRAWAAATDKARRQGEKLEMKSLQPDPVPAGEDFGQAPLFAPLGRKSGRLEAGGGEAEFEEPVGSLLRVEKRLREVAWRTPPPWMAGQSNNLAAWARVFRLRETPGRFVPRRVDGEVQVRFETAPKSGAGRSALEELVEGLAGFAGVLEGVRSSAGRPHCRLPFDYESAVLSGDTSELVLLALEYLAGLRAAVALHGGRCGDALQDLELSFRLAGHARSLPGLYTQPSRATALAHGLQPLWDGLRLGCWDEAEIAQLQRLLAAYRPIEDMGAHRRLVALAMVDFGEGLIPTGGGASRGWTGLSEDDRRMLRWVRRVYPVGWSLQSQSATVDAWLRPQNEAPATRREGMEATARAAVLRGTSDPFFPVFVAPKLVQLWADGESGTARAEALARMAEVACAVERHRRQTGAVPETLEGLVPGWLAALPVDPMDGRPLRYRRVGATEFLVYSAGRDGRDDAGEVVEMPDPIWGPRASAQPRGDWVWKGGTGARR